MASSGTEPIELSRVETAVSSSHLPPSTPTTLAESERGPLELASADLLPPQGAKRFEALDSYPDGGAEAWLQVLGCSACLSVCVGGIYSWGIMQDALSDLGPGTSWIGSIQAASTAALAIPCNRLVAAYGPRKIALIGTVITSAGPLLGSFCSKSFAGLMVTEGLLFGVGQSLIFFPAATLPSSYFLKRRNLATGCTYAGGGIGGAGFSLLSSVLIKRVGIPWTLRVTALVYFAITFPASYFIKARLPRKPLRGGGPAIDWTLFRDARFVFLFCGGAFALFPLFGQSLFWPQFPTGRAISEIDSCASSRLTVPPFFLPLYASALGMSSLSGSLLLAGFNLASAAGRIGFGLGADRYLGSLNSQILCLFVFGVTTFIIWPLATTLTPLVIFAVVNGAVNGGFFSLMPGSVASLFGTATFSVTFGMILSSWAPGYCMGAPIAGYILEAAGGSKAGYGAFRPAIFYSGALATVSCAMLTVARVIESRDLKKRV
ncbi:BQ5605_C019g09029 [Microbotryum silenes-dioicae]|uniref:BQ5605_C019g09029 protein n=1 Tax=Microbotryum silenes-dioicae TaxID=796604 RepID=A0A2X0MI67_9BASI|nr:BQ5605_C019g09029 [Microbotryum silenes-dioicae]